MHVAPSLFSKATTVSFTRNMPSPPTSLLQPLLAAESDLDFAVLIGSRASGSHATTSDWDIALQWRHDLDWLDQLSRTETLRCSLAKTLGLAENDIDLIDAPRASLAMRAVIAEEGVVLKGGNDLPWLHFLRRTWRELEDYYWETIYAPGSVPG